MCKLPKRPEGDPTSTLIVCPGPNGPDLICMTGQAAVDMGLWVRKAEQYFEAGEVCRGK